ncbi:transposase [Mesoterricola silvestris]|uniref:transposase n=1 Tax=Mesoterricola silvestris TaxID=2927979 RepID=UPI00374200FB
MTRGKLRGLITCVGSQTKWTSIQVPQGGGWMPRSLLADVMWDKLVPLLPPEKGETGRPTNAHRPWLEAILWKHRTGAPWRDLPEEFGSWRSIYSRFNRWSKVGRGGLSTKVHLICDSHCGRAGRRRGQGHPGPERG